MSLGYSIGDLITVTELAWTTYQKCKDATSAYHDIGRDVYSAHTILKAIHTFWKEEQQRGTALTINEQEELKVLVEECRQSLEDLEDVYKTHSGLGDQGQLRYRVKFVFKDFLKNFAAIRERLQQSIAALAILNATLTAGAQSRALDLQTKQLNNQAQILKFFVLRYHEFQEGKRDAEPAFSQSAHALKTGTDVTTEARAAAFSNIGAELKEENIEVDDLELHRPFIEDWISVVVLEDEEGVPDENESTSPPKKYGSPLAGNDGQGVTGILGQTQQLQLRQKISEDSIDTHRSKDSRWEDPDPGWEARRMLSKVFRSKYPPKSGGEKYGKPIKRVFNHLDHTGRGWLSQSMVKTCCLEALASADCNISPAEIDEVIRKQTQSATSHNFQIGFHTFMGIVHSLRELVNALNSKVALELGLKDASLFLRDRFASSEDPLPLPSHWKLISAQSSDLQPTFTSAIMSKDPVPTPPLKWNITNAFFLATQYCATAVSDSLTNWRTALRAQGPEIYAEYTEPLDKVLECTTKFYELQEDFAQARLHPLDSLTDDLELIPDKITEGNFEISLHTLFDEDNIVAGKHIFSDTFIRLNYLQRKFRGIMLVLLSFVSDLKVDGKISSTPPELKAWRRLRMNYRAWSVSSASEEAWNGILPRIGVCKQDLPFAWKVRRAFARCVAETSALQWEQKAYRYGGTLSFESIQISGLSAALLPRVFLTPCVYVVLVRTAPDRCGIGASAYVKASSTTVTIPCDSVSLNNCDIMPSHSFKLLIMIGKGSVRDQQLGHMDIVGRQFAPPFNTSKRFQGELTLNPAISQRSLNQPVKFDVTMRFSLNKNGRYRSPRRDIVEHPIPPDWKLRTTQDGRVYFFRRYSLTGTLALWRIPEGVSSSQVIPLPPSWALVPHPEHGIVYCNKDTGMVHETPPGVEVTGEGTYWYLDRVSITHNNSFYNEDFAKEVQWPDPFKAEASEDLNDDPLLEVEE